MVDSKASNFAAATSGAEAIDSEYAQQQEELRNLEELLDDEVPPSKSSSDELTPCTPEDSNPEAPQTEAKPEPVTPAAATADDDPDERSIFVKNVDFSADEPALTDHFKECGEIVRVTIRKNPHTQQSLG